MIPLGDEIRARTIPWVNYTLIGLNFLVFFFELSLGPYMSELVRVFGFVPLRFFHLGDLYTLITSCFLHAGWLHILGNMLYLWVFGDNVEDALGHFTYLLFYLASGAAGALLHGLIYPTSRVPLVGASGAISGVLGAYMLLYPGARIRTLVFFGFIIDVLALPAWLYIGLWFLMQALNGLLWLPGSGVSGVAWFAHIGGFLFGLLAAIPIMVVKARALGRRRW